MIELRRAINRRQQFPMAFIALAIYAGCAAQSTPTAPAAPAAAFAIATSVDVLKVGETWTLATVNAKGRVTWRSSDPSILAISDAGQATALTPGTATLTAADGRSSIDTALRVVPALDGWWKGSVQLLSYTRVSGGGPMPPASYDVGTYELVVQQTHGALDAHDTRYTPPESLHGTVDVEGRAALKGDGVLALPSSGATEETTSLVLRLNGDTLNGDWTHIIRFTAFFGPQVIEARRRLFDLRRHDDRR